MYLQRLIWGQSTKSSCQTIGIVVVSLRNCWGVWQILRRRFSERFEWGGLRSRQRVVSWRATSMLPHLLQKDWREQLVDSHPAWHWSRLRERHCRPFTGKLWCWHCWIRTMGWCCWIDLDGGCRCSSCCSPGVIFHSCRGKCGVRFRCQWGCRTSSTNDQSSGQWSCRWRSGAAAQEFPAISEDPSS